MLDQKHTVRVCDISALPTLRGPQSVPDDLGQYPVPEEPGLVPDPVTGWEGETRATARESQMFSHACAVIMCKCVVGSSNLSVTKPIGVQPERRISGRANSAAAPRLYFSQAEFNKQIK